MERLNFELSIDADLNVKRPIAASARWVSRRAIGEFSSKRNILTLARLPYFATFPSAGGVGATPPLAFRN